MLYQPALDFGDERMDPGRALDDLFYNARIYRHGKSFKEMLSFVSRFRFYKPFNAMLAHIQMPGATYVATASRWRADYRHRVKAGAQPIVILRPGGPVMFVFDARDVVPEEGAPELPAEIIHPFETFGGDVSAAAFKILVKNALRDGVEIADQSAGSQHAGVIKKVTDERYIRIEIGANPKPKHAHVRVRYEILLNSSHSLTEKFVTLSHELGHLYCGHMGTPNNSWWPDRSGFHDEETCEFEAESVSYIVCTRLGVTPGSDSYLSQYLDSDGEIPPISLERIRKAAGLIESMHEGWLGIRKTAK